MDILVITGPLGSGKGYAAREVAQIARDRGLAVVLVDLDQVNRELLVGSADVVGAIEDHCGPGFVVGGCVDTSVLADLVFSDGAERAWLESLTHAAIAARLEVLVADARSAGADLLVVEAPLPLASSPAAAEFGRVLAGATTVSIAASPDVRHALAQVRGDDSTDAARRIAAQPDQALYDAGALAVITNSGDPDAFLAEVRRVAGPLVARGRG